MMKNPFTKFFVYTIGTGFGLGYAPIASGTFGSLLGIPLGICFLNCPTWVMLLISLFLFVIGAWFGQLISLDQGKGDSGLVVIDEILGQALAFLGLRRLVAETPVDYFSFQGPEWPWIIAVFIFFRLFDIGKPFPAKTFDRRKDGFGIMADDVVAGLYAALVVWAIARGIN